MNHGEGVVLVLLPMLPAAVDWASASAVAAPSISVRADTIATDAPPRSETAGLTHSHRSLRPKRLFWRANRFIACNAVVRLIDRLAARGKTVELIHGHFYAASAGLPGLLARRGIPYVVSEHSSAFTTLNPTKEISKIGLSLAESIFGSAALVLPVSQFLEGEIQRRGLPGKTKVVPNPVDTELFRPSPSSTRKCIVSVARLDPVKRLDLLLKAVAEMAATERDVRLEIVGSGPELPSLTRLASNLGIQNRTTFHGWLDRRDIPPVLGQASVFALSSFTENLPVAMIEALSCGVPVVGPDVGGVPEIVNDAPGALFAPGDVRGLARSLSEWIDPSDRQRGAARTVALQRYSIQAVGAQLKDVYQKVVKETSSGQA